MLIPSFDSETDLLQALRSGDEAALNSIYGRFRSMAVRFVQQNNGRATDADDLLQEAIITLYENLQQPTFTVTSQVKTYLYSIIRYRWLAQLRAQQRLVDTEAFLPNLADEPAEDEETWPDEAQLGAALEALGDPCRAILLGYYYERLSLEQLAQRLRYAGANVVKQQKFRCIERLKNRFLTKD